MCSYLENNGLQCEGLFQCSRGNLKLAERLRSTSDFEGVSDVFTTALLLQLWLKELPEPIMWSHVASEIMATHMSFSEESVGTWRQAIRLVLCTLPERNLRLLRYLFRFLHRYSHHQHQRSAKPDTNSVLNHLGSVFAPLLILRSLNCHRADQLSAANVLTARLIQDHASLFHQWLLDHPSETSFSSTNQSPGSQKKLRRGVSKKGRADAENATYNQHRKRKERNESSNSNQSLERKVIRSSSEERRIGLVVPGSEIESIRRVSSHEDFRNVKPCKASVFHRQKFTALIEISDQPPTAHSTSAPLQECNHINPPCHVKDIQTSTHREREFQPEQPQPIRGHDHPTADISEEEHERRRSSERFSWSVVPSRAVGRRAGGRKPRGHRPCDAPVDNFPTSKIGALAHKSGADKSILQTQELPEQQSLSLEEQDGDPEAEVDSLSDESRPGSSHSFLQLHPPERERSPSPSVSPCTPPLDLTTLHQSVDGSEPVTSRVSWDFIRPQHQTTDATHRVLLSPRNSILLTRQVFTDHNVPPSPPGDHHGSCPSGPTIDVEAKVTKLHKQIQCIKKKLKRYEEGFEHEFGYRPSQSDKMANKDIKRMCFDLSRIRKELKQIRENPLSVIVGQSEPSSLHLGMFSQKEASSGHMSGGSIEVTVAEVGRRLKEKRLIDGRPESIDEMTPEEQAAEKLAMQKGLLMLEKVCGRATNKQDREIVRPLYDRYRQLKRIVARANSSKLKDSITELATIHEHEAMDFIPPSAPQETAENVMDSTTQSSETPKALHPQPSTEETSDSQTSSSDSIGENLHALPLSDLIVQLKQIREEKKKLRRILREQEEQFQQRTGRRMQREDRAIAASLVAGAGDPAKDYSIAYTTYKQVKAKLRLLEALVAKQR